MPDVVFCDVVGIILVELVDGGGHVEEARVEAHKPITRHAGADQGVVVMSSGPSVVKEPPFLGDSRDDKDTHHTIQALTTEGVRSGVILVLLPRHRREAARQLLRPTPIVLVLLGWLRFVGAEVHVLVDLRTGRVKKSTCWGGRGGGTGVLVTIC